jgi:hypothetical protein
LLELGDGQEFEGEELTFLMSRSERLIIAFLKLSAMMNVVGWE